MYCWTEHPSIPNESCSYNIFHYFKQYDRYWHKEADPALAINWCSIRNFSIVILHLLRHRHDLFLFQTYFIQAFMLWTAVQVTCPRISEFIPLSLLSASSDILVAFFFVSRPTFWQRQKPSAKLDPWVLEMSMSRGISLPQLGRRSGQKGACWNWHRSSIEASIFLKKIIIR